jgi:hypothetical protein
MKQLELFKITPEEKKFLEMIKTLEDQSVEIDILKYDLISLRSELEEGIRSIEERFNPPDDYSIPYDENHEYEYVETSHQDYYLDKEVVDFQSLIIDSNTKIH